MCQKTITMLSFAFTQQLEILSEELLICFKIDFQRKDQHSKSKPYLALAIRILFVGTRLAGFIWNKCNLIFEIFSVSYNQKCVC